MVVAMVVLAAEAETGGNLLDHRRAVVMAGTGTAELEEAAIEDTIVEAMARPGIREVVVAVVTAEATEEVTTTATRSHDGDDSVASTTPTVTPQRRGRRKERR